MSGAGRGAGAEAGEEVLGAGVGLAAAGLVAAGGVGLAAPAGTAALPGLGAVGGPRGFGETGGGTRLGSGRTEAGHACQRTNKQDLKILLCDEFV